jgi:osmotically-inducible protein OsmY
MADKDKKQVEPGPDFAAPSEVERSEEQIRLDVLKALAGTEQINAAAISIQVDSGTVRLAGEVDNQAQKEMAESITHNVPGVHAVENNLIAMEPTPLNQLPSLNANRPAEQ